MPPPPRCCRRRAPLAQGFDAWANPSSPHKPGRAARLAGRRAGGVNRAGVGAGAVFTSGASEALALAIRRAKVGGLLSAVEHEAVLRPAGADAERLPVDADGRVDLAVLQALLADGPRALVCVQQVNSETGVIQPLAEIAALVRAAGGILLADAAQGAGKIALPDADLIALSAHKFGGPIGIGALLIRDFALLEAPGGQERGYRGGTENLPGALAMAAALEAGDGWMAKRAGCAACWTPSCRRRGRRSSRPPRRASHDRRLPDAGHFIGRAADRFDSWGSRYRPAAPVPRAACGQPCAVRDGPRCEAAGEVLRVSIGRETDEAAIALRRGMARHRRERAGVIYLDYQATTPCARSARGDDALAGGA
jgi:cysteine desulfurase